MQIHLSDITDSEGKIIQISSEVELEKITFQMGEFPMQPCSSAKKISNGLEICFRKNNVRWRKFFCSPVTAAEIINW